MAFFRRPSKVGGGEITPPIQVIEELKGAIADLKDELANALQAKQYAKDDLRQQLAVQERTEAELASARRELDSARAQLLEAIARQQAEVPVMAAPSPNGTARIRLETEEGVEVIAVEPLRERVKFLEGAISQAEAEIASLKSINSQNVSKLKQLLHDKTRAKDLEAQLEEATNRIAQLERELDKRDEAARDDASMTSELEEMKSKISDLTGQLEVEKAVSNQLVAMEAELVSKSDKIASLEQTISKQADECADMENLWISARAEALQLAGVAAELASAEDELAEARSALAERNKEAESELREHVKTVANLERKLEENSLLIETLRNDLATASEASGTQEELDKLRETSGEYEAQILELINQVAVLRNENEEKAKKVTEISTQLDSAQREADEASRRLDTVHSRIDEAREALQGAIRASLEAKKEAHYWRNKYVTDLKLASERIKTFSN